VANKVVHQHVQDVGIQRHGTSRIRHDAKSSTVCYSLGRAPCPPPDRMEHCAAHTDAIPAKEHMIKGIKFVTVPVRDQDRALAFYTERLGFMVATDQPFNDSQRWIELKLKGVDTRVVLFTIPEHEQLIGQPQPVTFYSADVAKTYEELGARGVEFTGPPVIADWGSSVAFRDPDGNQFVVASR